MIGRAGSDSPSVLITGAAGRLGSTVSSLLHREGFDLLATDVVDATDVPYRFEHADLLDHERGLVLLEGIDVLLHIGNHPGVGASPPQLVFNENISMNENMFQGAAERGVTKIVFASTLQLVGSHVDRRTVVNEPRTPAYPLDETMAPDPSNVYALSKTVSEVMLRYYAERCGIDCVALRLPLLHHSQDRVRVSSGEERPNDVLEGFLEPCGELFILLNGCEFGNELEVHTECLGLFRTCFNGGSGHHHNELEQQSFEEVVSLLASAVDLHEDLVDKPASLADILVTDGGHERGFEIQIELTHPVIGVVF